jgi:signal transduction histidine kinase
MARVSVENWGVPVPAEEIEGGLVFRIGFRGRMSGDRGRPGTGVGLADSLAIARAYLGTVEIQSRPAVGGDAANYGQAFVTTAHFEIPVSRKKGSFAR